MRAASSRKELLDRWAKAMAAKFKEVLTGPHRPVALEVARWEADWWKAEALRLADRG